MCTHFTVCLTGCGLLLALSAGALVAQSADDGKTGQQAQNFEKQVTIKFKYLLFLPEDYYKSPDKKYPTILFLHGAGERGDNLNQVKRHGPPKILENKKDFPFIVISPQCPPNGWWDTYALSVLLDDIEAKYRVDKNRLYLTGLSMGGYGTWDLATRQPGRFAAIAPICGGGNPVLAGLLKETPTWVFHGDADPVVPVQRSDEMVEALKKIGAEVKYTRYRGLQHDSWTTTYDNPELYKWFLEHERKEVRGMRSRTRTPTTAPSK